jgi:DNA-binding MarR family transcriptional regulator
MLSPAGIRISQFSLLALVYELGAPTMNEIAERVELDRTTAGKNLQPLERAGLITTSRSKQDGRIRVAELTEKGRATLKKASVLWRSAQQRYEQANGYETVAEFEGRLTSFRIPRLRKQEII